MSPADAFEDVRARYDGVEGVADGRMFQCDGLKYGDKFFAAHSRGGEMLVKLPADRVTALIDEGVGLPFDANKGRVMREWMLVRSDCLDAWPQVAAEAFAFAQSLARKGGGRPLT